MDGLNEGEYYVCPGLMHKGYDVAAWLGDRVGIEFDDPAEARRLAELLNSGRAVVNHKTLTLNLG